MAIFFLNLNGHIDAIRHGVAWTKSKAEEDGTSMAVASSLGMFMTASSSCARAFGLWRVGMIVFMCLAASFHTSFRMRP